MEKCEKCGKNSIYIASDRINAWCRFGCGSYFYDNETKSLIYLAKDIGQYPVTQSGKIRKLTIHSQGNTTITEEERLVEIENKIKTILKNNNEIIDLDIKISNWFYNMTKEQRRKIYFQCNQTPPSTPSNFEQEVEQ